jgi:sugar/nucleoside kinase (ribokinase family)
MDITPKGLIPGGAVTYGTRTARGLGWKPAMVTSGGVDLNIGPSADGIELYKVPSQASTVMLNSYTNGKRSQFMRSVAAPIHHTDIPPEWRSIPAVFLGPMAGELDGEIAKAFPEAVIVASIQGWLRQWDANGVVRPKRWTGTDVLPYIHAAVVSMEDTDDHTQFESWAALVPVLVVTMGSRGSSVHFKEQWHSIAPYPAKEVDPTGAGDVYSVSYLVRYMETRDPIAAARFASCAASFCVEAPGITGIPSRALVEERFASTITQPLN